VKPRRAERVAFALALATAVSSSACAHVPPYARGRLAHPSMQMEELAGPAEAHIQAVHEGATGGTVGAASGCGCN
jgi:hypothetical protein